MAAARFALLCIAAILFIHNIRADVSLHQQPALDPIPFDDSLSSSSLTPEFGNLNSKIHSLESLLDEKTQELKGKDKVIADQEKAIRDKSSNIVSLQTEITTLRKKGTTDAQEKMGKAHARADELENQVNMLKSYIDQKDAKIAGLQENLNTSKDKIVQLNIKLNDLQKVNDELNIRVRKTERALLIAEEGLKKAKLEATSKTKELFKVRNAWIPHWLASWISLWKSFLEAKWIEYGKPALDIIISEILEKKALVEKWAEPHIYTLKNKHIPALKEKWVLVVDYLEPHMKIMAEKITDLFETYRIALSPYVVKLRKTTLPYIREARRISQPVINQVATGVRPYVNTVRMKLKPYTTNTVPAYLKVIKSVEVYHSQVRGSVYNVFRKYDLTKHLATAEFVWLMASTLLLFPLITLFRILYAIIRNKKKPSARNHNKIHGRRKTKKLNLEKERERERN